MKTILVIILVLAVVAGAIWVATKYFGLFADADKDGIPDEVEEKVEDAKQAVQKTTKEVKRRAKRVKEEIGDIGDAAKELANQVGDVAKAAKGKPRTGRKPKAKK
jgi:F0F1-type ATP synthase membrane subunit b/b'